MADKAKDTVANAANNAPGGRGLPEVGDTLGKLGGITGAGGKTKDKDKDKEGEEKADEGFGLDNKDVKGSLKVHIKLDLEADIRVIARIRGDIAIGLL